MFNTLKKLFIRAAIAFLLVLLLALTAYQFYFAPKVDRYLTRVIQQLLAKEFEREVTIGNIHLDLLRFQVVISEIAIARERALADGALLSAKAISVNILWRSLLSRDILIENVILDTPNIWIAFDKQGRSNLPQFGDGKKKAPKPPSRFQPEKLVERLYFPHIQIKDGTVYFAHQQIPLTVSIQRLNTTASLLLKGLLVQANLQLQGGEVELQDRGKMAISLAGDVGFAQNSLNVSGLQLQIDHSALTINGTLANLSQPELNLAVQAQIALDELDRYLKIHENLSGLAGFDGTVTGKIADILAKGHVTCAQGTAWKLAFQQFSADAAYHAKRVEVANLDARIFDGRIRANGRLALAETPRYTATATLENIQASYINTIISQQLRLSGLISGEGSVTGGKSFDFEDLALQIALKLRDVKAYGVAVDRADADIGIRDRILDVRNFDADMFEGNVKGGGTLMLHSNFLYDANLDIQQVHLDPVMALIPDQYKVSGLISGKALAHGSNFDLEHLTLETQVAATEIDAYNVHAKRLEGSARIHNRILSIAEATAQLFDGEVKGRGDLVLTGNALPKFDAKFGLNNVSIPAIFRQFVPKDALQGMNVDGVVGGDVAVKGNSFALKDITGDAALQMKGNLAVTPSDASAKKQTIPLNASVAGSLRQNIVTLTALDVDSSTLKLATTGTINVANPEFNLDYQVASQDIRTLMNYVLLFVSGIAADSPIRQFSGNIKQLRGTIQGPVSDLAIHANGHFTKTDFVWIQPDDLAADVVYQGKTLQVKQVKASRGSARIEASGSIDLHTPSDPKLDTTVSVASGNVADYLAFAKQDYPITGTVQPISTTIRGSVRNLTGKIPLTITKASAWQQSIDKVSGDLELAENRLNIQKVVVKKNGGAISGKGFIGFDSSFQLSLSVAKVNFHDFDALKMLAVQYDGYVNLSLDLQGTFAHPHGKADIRFSGLKYNGKPTEDMTCDVTLDNKTLRAAVETFRKKFIAHLELTLNEDLWYRVDLLMNQAAVEQIASVFVEFEGITGIISGAITSEGSLQNTQKLAAKVKLTELQLDVFGQKVVNKDVIDLTVTQQKLTVNSLELSGDKLGVFVKGVLDFRGTFDLDVDGIIDLRAIKPFLPKSIGVTSLNGHAQLICDVRGRFDQPEIEGIAEINDANVQVASYPDPVTNIQGKLAFSKGKIDIVHLDGKVSKGTVTARGVFGYKGLLALDTFQLDVEGKELVLPRIVEAFTAKVSPRVRITGTLENQKVAGEVMVHEALYSKELDLRGMIFGKNRNLLLVSPDAPAQDGQVTLDLLVNIPQGMQVKNKFAELTLRANLHVQGTPEKPSLEGRVEVLKGRLVFGDIKYDILSGIFDFLDPTRMNPEMNIQVSAVVQNINIALGIQGNLDKFNLEMSSTPPLSDSEITRLLAAGSGSGMNGYSFVTRPLQTLVEGKIEQAVKLDRFSVDVDPQATGAEGTPIVTLGKRLFKDLLVTFKTSVGGSEKSQIVEVEYQLSDNVSLTARRNEKGEIDTSFTFKFKLK